MIKKIYNAKIADLMRLDTCVRGIRVEKALLATLFPMNEIDTKNHANLLTVMEN